MVETVSLEQMLRTYQHLTAEHQAGRLTEEQYANALKTLQGIDQTGHWWGVKPGGQFWMHNGTRWVPATPPVLRTQPGGYPPPATGHQVSLPSNPPYAAPPQAVSQVGPSGQGIQVPRQVNAAAAKGSALLQATPILAVIPSVVCGALWFLYTFLGVFKGENFITGVDWLTPVIIGIIPVLLWLFKKQLDRLLLPLKPAITSVAKPLRLGIVIAIPLLLSCVCTSLTPSGFAGMNFSSFVSVFTAAVLMRY